MEPSPSTPPPPSPLIIKQIPLQEFFDAWNREIACRTSCQFYQYRLQYIDCLKTLLVRKFDQIIKATFLKKQDTQTTYILRYDKQLKSVQTKLFIEIQISTPVESHKLQEGNTRVILDKIRNTQSSSLILRNVSLVNQLPEEVTLLNSFSSKLGELLLYFVVESHRIDPSLVKDMEESVQLLQAFTYNQLERVKETHLVRLELNLIDQSKYSQETLRSMITSPAFCKYFNMVKVESKNTNRVKYVCQQSIKQPKGKDYLTFQDRNYSFQGFRKHICYLFPFWFTLELMLKTQSEKPHCEVMLVPPMFSDSVRQKLTQKIINYIINLSEATNVKVLLNLMEKKHLCPFSPYELFINNKVRRIGNSNKNEGIVKPTVFKAQFLYVSAYPLYERFAHGNGLENIKKSQLWKSNTVENLEYTYVVRFKSEIFIVLLRQDTPYKEQKNLTIEGRMRKLLIYEVYGVDTGISKEEIDFELRRRIRQSQLQPLLNKISEHLIKAPEVLNRSELQFLQNGKKQSFKITLPYMSCYGIYLSYLKQKLNYIHRKTSKRRQFVSRKMSHLQVQFFRETEVVRFSSYVQDSNLEEYEYSYNEEDDMLFLFNYAAPRGNENQPFGNCIYLLSIGILNGNKKLQEISQYVYKQPISSNSRKKSFYIYGVDPTEGPIGDKYKKQIKQLIENLNEIFPSKDQQRQNRDSDAISSSSSFSGSDNIYDDMDTIPAERKYDSLTIEFKYQIIGNEDFTEIQKYCETQVESTYCDYLIQGIIFRLKQSMDQYIRDLPLMNKKKKKLSFDDIECVIEDSLNHLIPLDRYQFMKKSLTIFNYQTVNMRIDQYMYYEQILSEVAKNVVDIINQFTGIILKKVDMVYYVLNSNKKLINYGNYSKLLMKGDYSSLIKTLNPEVEIGVLLGSHLSQLFQKIDEDSKKSSWTHSIKQYPDGKFFNSDTFVFKRSFLLKISIGKDGIRYFSYNVNRNINYSIVKNVEAIVEWNQERRHMLETLKNLKANKIVSIPNRVLNVSLLSIGEVWDPYREIEEQKQYQLKKTNKSTKPLSLTSLFKLLVFQAMPPIQKTECAIISHTELNRIYELLKNQKINFQKYGEVPKLKNPPFKCQLGKLGFQVLSILRFMVLKEWKRKQDDEDI